MLKKWQGGTFTQYEVDGEWQNVFLAGVSGTFSMCISALKTCAHYTSFRISESLTWSLEATRSLAYKGHTRHNLWLHTSALDCQFFFFTKINATAAYQCVTILYIMKKEGENAEETLAGEQGISVLRKELEGTLQKKELLSNRASPGIRVCLTC